MKNNEDVMTTAVRKHPWALCHASLRLKENRELCVLAVSQEWKTIRFCAESVITEGLVEDVMMLRKRRRSEEDPE